MLSSHLTLPCSLSLSLSPSSSATSRRCFLSGVILLLLLLTLATGASSTPLIDEEDAAAPRHFNFFRTTSWRGRRGAVTCSQDPSVCSDREKNPWGGDTCCFGNYCKDTMRDGDNCGGCGVRCGYGLVCCGGRCVDVQNDPLHCGSCFEECPPSSSGKCSFAMCDYGG